MELFKTCKKFWEEQDKQAKEERITRYKEHKRKTTIGNNVIWMNKDATVLTESYNPTVYPPSNESIKLLVTIRKKPRLERIMEVEVGEIK